MYIKDKLMAGVLDIVCLFLLSCSAWMGAMVWVELARPEATVQLPLKHGTALNQAWSLRRT